MSQREFALQLEALNDENLQLLQHIDYLEERLSQYEDVPTIEETVNMTHDEVETTDEWNVWPYSWATAAWSTAVERFHSFHGRLHDAQLAKHNARTRRHYERAMEEGELTLM